MGSRDARAFCWAPGDAGAHFRFPGPVIHPPAPEFFGDAPRQRGAIAVIGVADRLRRSQLTPQRPSLLRGTFGGHHRK